MSETIKRYWDELWANMSTSRNKEYLNVSFRNLNWLYSQPHREYHTIQHLEHCFREYEEVKQHLSNPTAVQLFIFYHDAEYDPRTSDNEEMSAIRALNVLHDMGLPLSLASEVLTHIISTKHHVPLNPILRDTRYALDIDLAILGQPEDKFDEYERQIREEYTFAPDELFNKRRSEILHGILKRPRIYLTSHFHDKYELQSRNNLIRSIENLDLSLLR